MQAFASTNAETRRPGDCRQWQCFQRRDAVGKGGIVRDPHAGERTAADIAQWLERDMGWRIGGVTRFSFTPNEAAVVTFVFQREANGRRDAGRCVAQSAANLHEPACTRTLRAGSLRRYEPAGTDVVAFDGRVGGSRPPAMDLKNSTSVAVMGNAYAALSTARHPSHVGPGNHGWKSCGLLMAETISGGVAGSVCPRSDGARQGPPPRTNDSICDARYCFNTCAKKSMARGSFD